MPKMMPWKDAVRNTNVFYVIFPSLRGGYIVQATPTEEAEMIPKKPFPKEWRDSDLNTLKALIGVETILFCHKSGHLCAVGELEDAIKIAKKSLEINQGC